MKISNFLFNIMVQKNSFSFISSVPHNTSWHGPFYGDDFTQYSTAIKSTIHHQSNPCYLDSRSTNCILISSIIQKVWVLVLDSTQVQEVMRILSLQRILYLFVGRLSLVHCCYIGLITNQFVHRTWALQHIHIHTCKYIHIVK